MKKTLIVCTCLFITYWILQLPMINPLLDENSSLKVPFTIINQKLYQEINGELEPFEMIGLNLSSVLPGTFPNEKELDPEIYLEWFSLIKNLGITVLRLPDLMPSTFYEALLTFNEKCQTPLYILQGIALDEVALADGMSIQSLHDTYLQKIKQTVDFLYGKGYPGVNSFQMHSRSSDISAYLLGYSLGMEWDSRDLIFSEIMSEANRYEGTYFYTQETASSVESFFAQMMDELVKYEVTYYGMQHLITLVGSNYEQTIISLTQQKNEPIQGERVVKKIIDLNQIKMTHDLESGYFASYLLYPVLSDTLVDSVSTILSTLEELSDIPVVISEYGIPSTKAVYTEMSEELIGINEQEQAEALVKIYKAIKQSNVMGSFLSDWQDRWDRTAWTTVQEVILDHSPYWKNDLTYSQGLGLYTFDSSTSYPDNEISEWSDNQVLMENEQLQFSVQSDEVGLSFLINWNKATPANALYWIDLDVTPNSGSLTYEKEGLTFDSPIDFIIHINPTDQSRVFVQRYYDTYEFLQNETNLQIRPDQIGVSKDADEFVPILMEVKSRFYDELHQCFIDPVVQEIGKLLEGNANPKAPNFNSLSNYYRGEDYIEIKIPWGLLNFSDPSTLQIHDDYYKNFGIAPLSINDIRIGLTVQSSETGRIRLNSETYHLTPWNTPTYEPRLKPAYKQLQKVFLLN